MSDHKTPANRIKGIGLSPLTAQMALVRQKYLELRQYAVAHPHVLIELDELRNDPLIALLDTLGDITGQPLEDSLELVEETTPVDVPATKEQQADVIWREWTQYLPESKREKLMGERPLLLQAYESLDPNLPRVEVPSALWSAFFNIMSPDARNLLLGSEQMAFMEIVQYATH